MKEEQGYLIDPYKTEFESIVREAISLEDGMTGVYLEQTFFYPESGGQPADRGTLNGKKVLDVQENGQGVLHVVSGAFERGENVVGLIDRERRIDHMQQHSGQHLLSSVFLDEFGFATIGFHLGEETCTIDLDCEKVTAEQAELVEHRVNGIIYSDAAIRDRVVSRGEYEEMAGGDVRSRLPDDVEKVRVVEIEGIDRSTCCGTHVRATGEIGIVKILKVDRAKGGPRIEFVCGARAFTDYAQKHRTITTIASFFSTDWRGLGQVIVDLLERNKEQSKQLKEFQSELARLKAAEYAEPTGHVGDYAIVKRIFDFQESFHFKEIASRIRDEKEGMIILFGTQKGMASFVFACSKDVPLDMGEILKASAQVIGAKGGGGKDFAQGGGGDGSRIEEALDEAERLIREKLS